MLRRKPNSEEGWLLSYADLITNLLVFFVMILSASHLSKAKFQQIAKSISDAENTQSLDAIQKEIEKKVAQAGITNLIHTQLKDEGLELSLNAGIMFDSGSAVIRQEWQSTIDKLLQSLVPYSQRYSFAVEGHTDSVPITKNNQHYQSNWELSSARAIELRNKLEASGVSPKHLRVEAYADTKPLPAEEIGNLSQEQQQARHRRVIVRIY